MFKSIASKVLKHCPKMEIIISGSETQMTVAIFPQAKSDVKLKPITISGPADQIDDQFEKALETLFVQNAEIFNNVKNVVETAKETKTETPKKPATSSTASTSAAKKEEPKVVEKLAPAKFKGNDAKIWKKIEEALAKAKKAVDIDIINWLQNNTKVDLEALTSQKELAIAEVDRQFTEVRNKITGNKTTTDVKPETPAGTDAGSEQESGTDTTEEEGADNDPDDTDEVQDDQEEDTADTEAEVITPEPEAVVPKPEPAKPAPAPAKPVIADNDIF